MIYCDWSDESLPIWFTTDTTFIICQSLQGMSIMKNIVLLDFVCLFIWLNYASKFDFWSFNFKKFELGLQNLKKLTIFGSIGTELFIFFEILGSKSGLF